MKVLSLRSIILIILAVFALLFGALLALPIYKKNFVKVEIKGVSVLAEVVADPSTRMRGLAGRKYLPDLGGMLFVFTEPNFYGIWMKGMELPIDIFWIKDSRVADLEENIKPPARGLPDSFLPVYRPDVVADFVLEVKAGFAQKHDIRIGDEVRIGRKILSNVGVTNQALVSSSSPVAVPGEEYFIEQLRRNPPSGSDFKIEKLLLRTNAYKKFLISYKSDGLTISGIMNVPPGPVPENGFPVLILNHGLIRPEIYFSGRGSKREQDFFARHGYITIHPDYRGLAGSSPDPQDHHDFYVGYTKDVVGLLSALENLRTKFINTKKIGMWGHSMGGGIAARIMVLRPDVRAFVLFAPVSADVEDNFYELTSKEIEWLRQTYGESGDGVYKKMSPLNYFVYVAAPAQIHHGEADKDVPIEFSERIFEMLRKNQKPAEFYKYPGEKHEFADAWPLAAERALQFFDLYVKGDR